MQTRQHPFVRSAENRYPLRSRRKRRLPKRTEKKKSSKKHVKKGRYSGKTKRPAVPVKAGEASEPVREDDYDGYYDDVRPFDEGGGREEIDKALVKKIILVVACVLLIAGACVALMYLI